MGKPLASVFTPSYNKGHIAGQAIQSVLEQDWPNIEYWVLENSDDDGATRQAIAPLLGDSRIRYEEIDWTPEERGQFYPPAHLLNQYYEKAEGDYIFVLADDDLLEPTCVSRCVQAMEADRQNIWVVWFTVLIGSLYLNGHFQSERAIEAISVAGYGTDFQHVDCRIDGGQVAHRTDCLNYIDRPWYPETPIPGHARHSDGLWLQKLANQFKFYPIPEVLMTHRRTVLSLWDKA